jgi:putative transposase
MSSEPRTNRTLSAEDVRAEAVRVLEPLIPQEIEGYRANRTALLETLVYAAAEGTSLHGACGVLEGVADDTTMRDHLNEQVPRSAMDRLIRRGKTLVMSIVPKVVLSRRQPVAIDTKDFPYYGHHPDLEPWICRGKARDGTTRFLRIATAYVMRHGERVTLAVIPVPSGLQLGEVVSELAGHLRFLGVKIKCLYLDRGFASVGVIKVIERLRLPAVIACPLRGSANSGVRQFCTGRASHTAHHVFDSQKYGLASVALAVVRSYTGGRRSKRKARWFVYMVIGQQLKPRTAHRDYRLRFGVETSYRILNQTRPRTTSRNPAVRYLLVLIGVVLANLWISLKRRTCLRTLPPRGFRHSAVAHIDDRHFRLLRFKILLRQAIELRYPPRSEIALSPP